MKKLCGWCKTLCPGINTKTDAICLECQRDGNDLSVAQTGDLK